MNVYVFGNEDVQNDSEAIKIAKKLANKIKGVDFVFVKPNEDVPFAKKDSVTILDTAKGINKVETINEKNLDTITLAKSVSVHDFDLGFQLKYLKKLGKLKKITIIAIPQNKKVNYLRIQSILRKLVAQDIHGS